MLASLRHEEENPDARLDLLVHKAVFRGHPYENRAEGTIDSVSKLTADQLRAHLTTLRDTNRLLLVVVGDIESAHVAELTKKHLAGVPRGSFKATPLPPVQFASSSVDVVAADLPTNYVKGTFTVPGWHDPDFFAAMVAMQHLGFRIFEEVRTKRNLSYAPHASMGWGGAVPLGHLYVTAVDPDTTMKVMFDEVKKLKSTPLTAKELAAAKSTFLTDHLASTEATDAQGAWLSAGQLHYGDWRFEAKLLEHVKQVTAEQVQAFATKYIQHLQMQVVGKKPVDKALFGSL
jgi:zinc protease